MILLPAPQNLVETGQSCSLPAQGVIVLDGPQPQALFPAAQALRQTLQQFGGREWQIAASASPDQTGRIWVRHVPGAVLQPQGYRLQIQAHGVEILSGDLPGAFYGIQTVRQVLEQSGADLPGLDCQDWPDYPQRGVMLDVSRDRVPTMETLYVLVDRLAGWKINQLQLYLEHTFAYRQHPEVWAQASPFTGEEILALEAYCRERFIELVPNQNTFGHMRRWLVLPRYRDLAEAPDGCDTRWGHFDEPFSLAPAHPGSLELVRGLMDELLPHFSSRQFNVGCDETVDLGQGASRELVEQRGLGRVYLDFLLQIYKEVKRRGYTMQFWGDIIMEHPELVKELPRDGIALEWGYEAEHPFEQHGAAFAASGIPFYVCPGTSSWNSLAGRTDNALANLRNAATNGLKHGAIGYLVTDWGDNGHWQPLPVSYLGFAYGAALAWGVQANLGLDVIQALDLFVFRDAQQRMGRLVYDLGNLYQAPGIWQHNSSALFNILQAAPETIRLYLPGVDDLPALIQAFQRTEAQLEAIMAALPEVDLRSPDASLIQREYTWLAEALRHACERFIWVAEEILGKDTSQRRLALWEEAGVLMDEYHQLWHSRSRPGGFQDSLRRFEVMRSHYRSAD